MRESRQLIPGLAAAMPGVVRIVTARDLPDMDRCRHGSSSCRVSNVAAVPALAADSAHFVGESSAAVLANKLKTRWRCSTSPTNPYPRCRHRASASDGGATRALRPR